MRISRYYERLRKPLIIARRVPRHELVYKEGRTHTFKEIWKSPRRCGIRKRSTASLGRTPLLLGITGGIAAYKAAMLCRLLKRQAPKSHGDTLLEWQFITPMTMATLRKTPSSWSSSTPSAWNSHALAGRVGRYLIAPPRNTLAKISTGVADNLLTAYLSPAPVVVA